MALRMRRGMGGTCSAQTASIFTQPAVVWDYIWNGCPTSIGVAPAPTGPVLTVPPASGADAQATVDGLLNQQMVNQQAIDAAGVQSSWWDSLTGSAYSTVSGVGSSVLPWVLGGVALLALVAVGGGSPRRYGR